MSYKKELHKIDGDENTMKEKGDRVLTARNKYAKWQDEEHVVTWKTKAEPKSTWYPETPSIHVYGSKK